MSSIVLIGPTDALASLREQFSADKEVQTFSEHDVRAAVEFIATTRPAVVAMEESFAVSPRGEALVGRIMDDPALQSCEIRVLADTREASGPNGTGALDAPAEVTSDVPTIAVPLAAAQPALDFRGTRRVIRQRMADGLAVTVDGNPAVLVDLTTLGAQVLSRIVLRPNQRVRLLLPEGITDAKKVLRCQGSVVWASFEMPAGQPPRYRAGLRLSGVDLDALQAFVDRHRVPAAAELSGEPG